MSAILFSIFAVLLLLGIPVAIALGIGTMVALVSDGNFALEIFTHRMVNGINSFTLVAVPLFIVAGRLAGETGIATRLVKFASALVGHIPGGLGLVNVLASMFFGGISGAAADTAAIGALLIPAMKESGYDAEYSGGITAASSTIGVLIPPSIPMCIYGITMGVSIGALFAGGLIPGIAVGIVQMIVAYVISKKRNYPKLPRATLRELWAAFKESFLALLLPVFMLLGVSLGIATPTEVGVIAIIYALILSTCVYKEYKLRDIPKLIVESGVQTSIAIFVVSVASVVSWIIAMEEIPAVLTQFLTSFTSNGAVLILLVLFFLFLVGCVMDLVPAMILFAPIFLPLLQNFGVHPVQFGVLMTIVLGIGLVTPPVGTCLFLASGISGTPLLKQFRAAVPFLIVNTGILLVVSYWQPFTMFVPRLLGLVS